MEIKYTTRAPEGDTMAGILLDVSTMPFEQTYISQNEKTVIGLDAFLDGHYDAIQALAASGLIKANESFGFAMHAPIWGDELEIRQSEGDFWDNPEEFVWFVGGWGPNRDRYIANAVRKMRALLRPTINGYYGTLDIRFNFPEHFRDKVDSQDDDGTFPWGDFPWGGAAFVRMGGLTLAGAVSCLSEIEDDFITKLILGGLGKQIVDAENMLSDN